MCVIFSLCAFVSCGRISKNSLTDSSNDISNNTNNPQIIDNSTNNSENFNHSDLNGTNSTDYFHQNDVKESTKSSDKLTKDQINDQSKNLSDDITIKPAWKLLIINETPPSNYTQNIIVIDESGTIYRYNFSDVNESFHIYAENWQEQLADICSSSNTAERLSDDDIKIFAEYMENIYKYREENIMTQKSQLKDYGVTVVYGIDYNNDNPEYTLICKYGSEISCIDNSITKKFANELIQLNLLYTMGYTFE